MLPLDVLEQFWFLIALNFEVLNLANFIALYYRPLTFYLTS
jgi:hypothetical protein